mmetsp:Transcript_99/g.250  ORF Transcript_99/g.250 Transcript_99/m.250 type:complete len:784 (+) Transcript_99:252-2603(+)
MTRPAERRSPVSSSQQTVSPETYLHSGKGITQEDHDADLIVSIHNHRPGPSHTLKTQMIVNATCALDGADAQLLPATFRALETQLGMRPSDMSLLSLAQSLCQSASSPVWGFCADRFSRRKFLAFGCFLWGGVTCLLAFVSSFGQMLVLRAVNGIALASVSPISQSIIAGMFGGSQRGRAFGWVQFFTCVGGMAGGVLTTSLSEVKFSLLLGRTVEGWRLAFFFVGISSFLLGFIVWLGARDVDGAGRRRKRRSTSYERVPSDAEPAFPRADVEEMENATRMEEGGVGRKEGKTEAKNIVNEELSPMSSSSAAAAASIQITASSSLGETRETFLEVPPRGGEKSQTEEEGEEMGACEDTTSTVPDRCVSTGEFCMSGTQQGRDAGISSSPSVSLSEEGEQLASPSAVSVRAAGDGGRRGESHSSSGSPSSCIVSFCRLCAAELSFLCSLMRTPSFAFIVLQGVFGSVPWNAMGFLTLYMQYCGLSDFLSSVAASCVLGAGAFGGMMGGILGDLLERLLGDHGRPLVAQLSVALGIPVTVSILHFVPREAESAPFFIGLVLLLGFVASWCSPGTNRPILCEMTTEDVRARTFSWLVALEGSSAALFGAPLVAFFAEKIFGYSPSDAKVSEMEEGARLANAEALARALTLIMVLPWTICFLIYGALHITYPRDKRRNNLNRYRDVDGDDSSHGDEEGEKGRTLSSSNYTQTNKSHLHLSPPPPKLSPLPGTDGTETAKDDHGHAFPSCSTSFCSDSASIGRSRKSPKAKRGQHVSPNPRQLFDVP